MSAGGCVAAPGSPHELSGTTVKDPDNDAHGVRRNEVCESTSRTLLEVVKRGDGEGWQRLVYLYTPLVVAWCRRDGVSAAEAEDITQEVFATVSKRIQDFHKQPGPSFRVWLRAITRNKLGDRLRRQSREPARGLGGTDAQNLIGQIADPACAVETDPEAEEDEHTERRLLCRRALGLIRSEFEPRTWQAFWRVVIEDRCPADAAAELGMTPNAVYIARSRILARLRELLAELGEAQFDTDHRVDPDPELA
jgi:RNA polymerase sigma-70 factor (ECF subfamily)